MMGVFLMSKRSPISVELKLHTVQRCLDHHSNPHAEAKHIWVSPNSIKDWIRKYKAEWSKWVKGIESMENIRQGVEA